jgi:signal peptidase
MAEGKAIWIGKWVLDWGSNAVLVLLLGFLVAALLAPHVLGWRYGILRSGSMSPDLPTGSAIVVEPVDADQIKPADVITYRSTVNRGLLTTHRVVEVNRDANGNPAFRTKGDANEEPDAGLVSADRLLGRVALSVPHVGKAAEALHTRLGFLLLLALPTALIIAVELRELAGGITALRREKRKEPNTGEDGIGSTA